MRTERMSIKEAAERAAEALGEPVAEETVRGWLRRGLIRGERVAVRVFILRESLEEFLRAKPYIPPDGRP